MKSLVNMLDCVYSFPVHRVLAIRYLRSTCGLLLGLSWIVQGAYELRSQASELMIPEHVVRVYKRLQMLQPLQIVDTANFGC